MTRIELRSKINNLKHGQEASINGYDIKKLGTQWVLRKGDHIKKSFDLTTMEAALDRILGDGQLIPVTRREKLKAKLQQRKESRVAKLSPVQLLKIEQANQLKQLKADLIAERKQARLDRIADKKAAVQSKAEHKLTQKVSKKLLKADAQFRKQAAKKAKLKAKRQSKVQLSEAKAIRRRKAK